MRWRLIRRTLVFVLACVTAAAFGWTTASIAQSWGTGSFCDTHEFLCTENQYNYGNGQHIGHDEPSLLFYSGTSGSGNSAIYTLTLPKDPPKLPKQDGTGGTFNFQLHPAFWFGMVMCDTQSNPEFTNTCTPDSDANIFDNPSSSASDYIGEHPGAAYMELQFYPPGWVTWPNGGTACDAKHWCAAMTIDSYDFDPNKQIKNNSACLNGPGAEPVNFAFITKSGVSDSAASPLGGVRVIPNLSTDFLMKPGDNLTLDRHDTAGGFQAVIYDNTSRKQGSMTASIANGFAQVNFAPNDSTCTATPYAFHPMFATSGPHTRASWTAHSYNVAFADEIGHWDYCSSTDDAGNCTEAGKNETDAVSCFPPAASSRIKIGGCTAEDLDFDGTSYLPDWPGTNPSTDKSSHPAPITFTSPLLDPTFGPLANYDMQTFEADLPIFEPSCDTTTGAGCSNPPSGAAFYPFFSTNTEKGGACVWQFGGAGIAGSTGDFGGVSQYGSLFPLLFVEGSSAETFFDDYQGTPASNPCNARPPSLTLPTKPIAFGSVAVGKTSAVHTLRISNPSLYPMTVGIALPSGYRVAAGKITTCPNPGVLVPGGKCQYGLTLSPSASGPDNGVATISSNASNASLTVSLTGTGK